MLQRSCKHTPEGGVCEVGALDSGILNEVCMQVRMCCQFDNSLEVTILPPYVPSEEEKASPALYAKNVQKQYAETLNLPIVDQVLFFA